MVILVLELNSSVLFLKIILVRALLSCTLFLMTFILGFQILAIAGIRVSLNLVPELDIVLVLVFHHIDNGFVTGVLRSKILAVLFIHAVNFFDLLFNSHLKVFG